MEKIKNIIIIIIVIAVEMLHVFTERSNSCLEAQKLRDRLEKSGGVREPSVDQWYHAVGYTVDDLRVHWTFPASPDVSGGGRGER